MLRFTSWLYITNCYFHRGSRWNDGMSAHSERWMAEDQLSDWHLSQTECETYMKTTSVIYWGDSLPKHKLLNAAIKDNYNWANYKGCSTFNLRTSSPNPTCQCAICQSFNPWFIKNWVCLSQLIVQWMVHWPFLEHSHCHCTETIQLTLKTSAHYIY